LVPVPLLLLVLTLLVLLLLSSHTHWLDGVRVVVAHGVVGCARRRRGGTVIAVSYEFTSEEMFRVRYHLL
jgi:hypothetical protein